MPETLYTFINWILRLHHIDFVFAITPFVFGKALLLIIITFISGYILGTILGWLIKKFGCPCGCCKK